LLKYSGEKLEMQAQFEAIRLRLQAVEIGDDAGLFPDRMIRKILKVSSDTSISPSAISLFFRQFRINFTKRNTIDSNQPSSYLHVT
jgi:hypothetical protein